MDTMGFVLFVLVCFLTLQHTHTDRLCPMGQYFEDEEDICIKCSVCPSNKVVLKLCHGHKDTKCGSFPTQFKFMQESATDSTNLTRQTDSHGDIDADSNDSTSFASPVEVVSDGHWYTLAIVLIGVVCVLYIVLAVYIAVTCYFCKKRRKSGGFSEYDRVLRPEGRTRYNSEGPRYAPDPTAKRIPAREMLKLHQNLTADDSDDDDDSGQAVAIAAPGSSPDNSGHAYVYIKKLKPSKPENV